MKILKIIFILLFTVFLQSEAVACAFCNATAGNKDNPESMSLAEGLNNGILYIMIIPYLILFFFFRKKIAKFIREISSMRR